MVLLPMAILYRVVGQGWLVGTAVHVITISLQHCVMVKSGGSGGSEIEMLDNVNFYLLITVTPEIFAVKSFSVS